MICKGTKKMQGCGMTKPQSDFYPTRKWHSNVCIECFNKYKREKYRIKLEVDKIISGAW